MYFLYLQLFSQAINTKIRNGFIKTSYVNGIVKGMRGNPGEKKATILNEKIGTIELNNEFGVFGTLDNLSLKNDLIKIGKSSSVHTGKAEIVTVINGSNKETFDIEIIEAKSQTNKDNAKECSNYCTIALISHASKVMLKILKAWLQQYMNCELPDV